MAKQKMVLFVCTANMCRSPMAEYIFRAEAGPQCNWRGASSGIAAASGAPASESAVDALRDIGIDLRPHRSQPLTRELVEEADLIVTMTAEHSARVVWRFPDTAPKVRLLTSFLPEKIADEDIPDPVGFGGFVYLGVRDLIRSCMPGLIEFARQSKG
jgi:protein-tyrosine-phosphatase